MVLPQFSEVETRMRKMGYPTPAEPKPTNVDIIRSKGIDKSTVRPDFALVGGDATRSDIVKSFDKLQKLAQD